MGEAFFEQERAFSTQSHRVAALLCRTPSGNLHAGLLYRNKAGSAVLHLAWQDRLSDDWPWTRLWAAPDLDPIDQFVIAEFCWQIQHRFEKERRFPYAIRFAGTSFAQDASLLLGPGARGLTCATFILAVFKAAGVELVDESSWPNRKTDDLEWLERVAEFAKPEHLAILRAEVESGCVRIRPDEVLGACNCLLPARFAQARAEADKVLEKLDAPCPTVGIEEG